MGKFKQIETDNMNGDYTWIRMAGSLLGLPVYEICYVGNLRLHVRPRVDLTGRIIWNAEAYIEETNAMILDYRGFRTIDDAKDYAIKFATIE